MSNHQTTIKNKYIVLPINMNSKTKKISFFEGDNLIFDFDETVDLLRMIGFKHVYMFNGSGFDSYDI